MKAIGPFKTIGLLFVAVLAFYWIAYNAIEHRRARQGPWLVTFTNSPEGTPLLRIDQPTLAISNVQLAFTTASLPTNFSPQTISFARPLPVPFPLPFGECIFMDAMSLPGAVVVRFQGREVQLLPRVLTIDGREHPWRSEEIISIAEVNTNRPSTVEK